MRDRPWLLEGDGRFFGCGDSRDHRDVTHSTDPKVLAARKRFERILQSLPRPKDGAPGTSYRRARRSYEKHFLPRYLKESATSKPPE